MDSLSPSRIAHILLLISAASSAAYAYEFAVEPTNQTVAPNSLARFECAVRGSGTYVRWIVDGTAYSRGEGMPAGYTPTWGSGSELTNTTLVINTSITKNGASIMCRAGISGSHKESGPVRLNIAAEPLWLGSLNVSYSRARRAVEMEWREPFTHLPQFPILSYHAEVKYLRLDQSLLKRETVAIDGGQTNFSLALNESELCSSSQVCVSLRARNEIGYSPETKTPCTNIEREHSPLPVNATLSLHPDGKTLVSVVFQVPPCFPQAMQSSVVVKEAPRLNPELTPELMLPEEGAHLMESYALTQLEQDVVYSVIIQLKSHTENTSSLPVYVTLPPAQATGPDKEGNGAIAGIVVAVLLAMLVIAALATAVAIFVGVHSKRKDTMVVNHMQPNPFYENTYYDSIPDGYSHPPVRSPSYDSHIYQDMPELVRRLQASNDLPHSLASPPPPLLSGQGCLAAGSSLEEMKRVQTVVAEAVRETERESEYITMHSVCEGAPDLQTEV